MGKDGQAGGGTAAGKSSSQTAHCDMHFALMHAKCTQLK